MRKQIIICLDNQKWMCDFIDTQEGKTDKELLDEYVNKYEEIRSSMEIVGNILPVIIFIYIITGKRLPTNSILLLIFSYFSRYSSRSSSSVFPS